VQQHVVLANPENMHPSTGGYLLAVSLHGVLELVVRLHFVPRQRCELSLGGRRKKATTVAHTGESVDIVLRAGN